MPLISREKKSIFEWKIYKYHENDNHNIKFILNGYLVDLSSKRIFQNHNLCQISLWLHPGFKYIWSFPPCPIFYTFSIIDCSGHVFVSSVGKLLKHDIGQKRMLIVIDDDFLENYKLIKRGTVTVRLNLHHEMNGKPLNCVTDGEPASLLETLSKDFSAFYESRHNTDCVLNVCNTQFSAHRAILSARSSVFSAMFLHDTSENHSGEVNIPDIEATIFNDLLYYIYSGKIRGLTAITAAPMYTAADKYDLLRLKTECLEFLKQNLMMENFCEAAVLANIHGEVELEEQVVLFIEANFDEVLESSKWQQFLKDKTLLASKLLASGFKFAKKKQFQNKI